VAWRGGVQLAGSVVWCDARRARHLSFLSHAHLPSRGAHRQVLTTSRTLALLRAVGGAPHGEVLVTPFGRPFTLGPLRLELFPSGHVPGAASLLLTEPSGRRVAYAGDVNPVRALGEAAEVRGSDVLVLEAPLAPSGIRLASREEMHALLEERVRRALAEGKSPLVIAPALGVAEEAIAVLAAAGVPLRAHRRIHAYASVYPSLGIALPSVARFAGGLAAGEALLWPSDRAAPPRLARPVVPIRVGGGGEIALEDHGDRDALVSYVLHSGAKQVYVTRGFCAPLVDALAPRGVRVEPLGPPRQMELAFC
jgi:putative mRNA 3-end processing factor